MNVNMESIFDAFSALHVLWKGDNHIHWKWKVEMGYV